MATLQSHCRTAGGVTLVELCVTATRPRRVRVENRLEGAVWPPRCDGVPEPGWDEDGFEGRVAPEEPLVLGYASPADPAGPPARIAEEREPADREPTPQAVVKALGRREPPRDAMPASGSGGADGAAESGGPCPDRAAESDGSCPDLAPDPDTGSPAQPGSGTEAETDDPPGTPFDAWFAAVEQRLEAAEDLAAAGSVEEAESAVDRTGGIAAVRRLQEQLQADRAALAHLDRRCSRARERAEAVDVPVEALAQLA